MFRAQPGYRSGGRKDGEAFLVIKEEVRDEQKRLVDEVEVAEFTLCHLPDSNEVVLLKRVGDTDEAVYSEVLA